MQCAGVEHVREKKRGKGRRKGGRESAGGKKNIAKRRFFASRLARLEAQSNFDLERCL